jgi:hypothetical protein
MDVRANGGVDPRIEFEVDGVVGLLVPLIKLCRRFKTLCMACPYVDFKRTNISSFYKTIMFNPSSFDVPILNFCNVSHKLSSKVFSWNYDSR